jgi:excisionase family DNA binding protein
MNASATIDANTVVVPTDRTRQRAVALESRMAEYLRQKRGRKDALKLLSADGELCDLPDQMADLLAQMAAIMARGDAVVVNALSRELSTTEAAVLLGMSRPTLIRLLETGAIPHRMVGTHRRVDLKQVLEFRRKRLDQQRKAYAELMRENDALGIVE